MRDSWEGLTFHFLSTKIFMWPMCCKIYAFWTAIRRPWLLRWHPWLTPVWISNHVPYNVQDEITYTFQTATATPFKFGKGRAGALVTPFCGMYLVFSLKHILAKLAKLICTTYIYIVCHRMPFTTFAGSLTADEKLAGPSFGNLSILILRKLIFLKLINNFMDMKIIYLKCNKLETTTKIKLIFYCWNYILLVGLRVPLTEC